MNHSGEVFVAIYVIVLLGGFLVALNANLIGSKINYFQGICLIGYCIFPLVISSALIRLIPMYAIIKLIIVLIANVWSSLSKLELFKLNILYYFNYFIYYIKRLYWFY